MSATLVSLWTDLRRRLEAAGVDTPVLDARVLVEAGAQVSRLDIVTDPRRPLSDSQVAAVEALARRREAREPVAQILGRKHFWTLDLAVNEHVLTPRPETELLVEVALEELAPNAHARILDLGVGSGAIVLALLSERPNATGVGVDASGAALSAARANAEALGLAERLELRLGNWGEGVDETFDLVVSNPPYVATADIAALEPEVARYEPRMALDGGQDGLSAYRAIAAQLPRLLAPEGAFALEVGAGQCHAVTGLLQAAGLAAMLARRDLAGIERVVYGRIGPRAG